MTALPPEVAADLERRVAELEQKLQAALGERNDSIAREAAIWAETARLYSELRVARDRQNATADILRTIATVSGDAGRSLQQIAETTARLFGAPSVSIQLAENGEWTDTFRFGTSAERIRSAVPLATIPVGGRNLPGTVVAENRQVHIPDLDHLDPAIADWPGPPLARAAGTRTMCGTPLRREGKAIGVLVVYRDRHAPFTDDELALQQSFADQAVIAIENARLFNEVQARTNDLSDSLQQQTAVGDVLKTISRSTFDLQPVLDTLVATAARLCEAEMAFIMRREGDEYRAGAAVGYSEAYIEFLRNHPLTVDRGTVTGRAVIEKRAVQIADVATDPEYTLHETTSLAGQHTALGVPLLRENEPIGTIVLARQRIEPFTQKQIDLVTTFADQAVIAIENVRLFNETKEALEQQKASADILRAISSSVADTQPAFDKILDSCKHLFGSDETAVLLVDDEGVVTLGAYVGKQHDAVAATFPAPVDKSPAGHAIRERRVVHYTDAANDAQLTRAVRHVAQVAGYEAMAYAPMMWNERGIGAIGVSRLKGAFSDKELALLQTFADQAAIAIQNARLFNETREALERQTATAEILKVIARSPSDTTPVFEAIASSAKRLLGGFSTAVFRFLDGTVHLAAFTPTHPAADAALKADFPQPVENFEAFRLAQDGKPFPIPDTEEVPHAPLREIARLHGFRSMLWVPMVNGGVTIGVISVTRAQPGAFASHHVQLLQTFADQAVIAIENTRLFNETREALERQTATADILKVIASSPSDVQPVFDAIAASANRLLGGFSSTVFRFIDGMAHLKAFTPTTPEADEICARLPQHAVCSTDEQGRVNRIHCGHAGSARHLRQPPCAAAKNLCRPGRHRHVRRGTGQDARSHGIAPAANRDRRRAQGHQPLGV